MKKLLIKLKAILFESNHNLYSKGKNSIVDELNDLVQIGDNFISAPGSIILAHDASLIIHTKKTRVEETIIGDNVFLGANAVILPGVTIGDNCIIGSGAIVTKSFPENSVIVGNPAKKICTLNDYIEKCEKKNNLYQVPDFILKKHGSNIKATNNEKEKFHKLIYSQYKNRNQAN